MKLKTPDMISESKLQIILAKVQHLLERQDREDLVTLQHVFFVHRLSCFDEHCICNQHQRILINEFFDAGDHSNLTKGIRKTTVLFKDDEDLANNGSFQGFDNIEVDPSQIELATEGAIQEF